MAHNLHKNTMVYAGTTPWHGLGIKLPANATWEQIAQLGGFYECKEEKVLTASGNVIPNKKALVRGDTGAALAVVSDSYSVVQFADVARTLVEAARDVSGAVFHTAGLLGEDGAQGWLLAELPRVIKVKGDASEIRPYLLGRAAHDGHNGVLIKNVATRVVCQNTLGSAMGEDSRFSVAIHHTRNAQKRLDEARKAFHTLTEGMLEFEQMANALAAQRFSEKQMLATVDALMPLPVAAEGEEAKEPGKLLTERREKVLTLFEAGTGITGAIKGTAWAAFQAWTEYADHHRVVRDDANGAKRLESIWLGRAADLKHDALTAITAQLAA